MKILNVFYSFKQGGVERLGIAIANQLANYRDVESDVCIISKEYSEELLSEFSKTVKVFKLESKRKLRKLQYVRQLIRIIKENEIDVVHVHQGNLMPFFLLIKTACPDVTFYFTVHDTYIFSSDLNEMDRKIANLICKRIIAISDGVVKDIRSCGIKKEKIKRIYNGINFDKFKMVERKDRKEPFKIINVARFYPQKKGQDVLIKATAILKERGYRIKIIFAGDEPQGVNVEMNRMKELAKTIGVLDNMVFLGNIQDVNKELEQADIFCIPSNYEGFGISAVEAMATGLPCVASNIVGLNEVVDDSRVGKLFEVGNEIDLANKLEEVITHIDQYNSSVISSYARKRFSIQNMCEILLEVYGKRENETRTTD